MAIDSGSDRKSSSNDSFIQVVKALSLMNCDAETLRVPAHAGGNGVEMSDGWLLNLEQRTNAKIRKGKKDVEHCGIPTRQRNLTQRSTA